MKKLFLMLAVLSVLLLSVGSTALAVDMKVETWQELRSAFQFVLDEVEYHAPAPVSQYLDNGWKLNDTHDVTALEPMTYLDYNTMEKDDAQFDAELLNATEEEQPLEGCVLTQMDIWGETPVEFKLSNGIGIGSSLQDVLDAYGLSIELAHEPEDYYSVVRDGEEVGSYSVESAGWIDYVALNYKVVGEELDLLTNVSRELYTSYSGDNYIQFQFDQPILAEGAEPKVNMIGYRIMLPGEE